jgi:hypothetical protein
MNERIIQHFLDKACYDETAQQNLEDWCDVEKFAELIVRECIDIAQDRAAFDGFPPNDVNHIIDEIKEHFGVKE